MRREVLQGILVGLLAAGTAAAAPGGFKAFAADIGTGLAVYMEFPVPGQDRPVRVVYDTGKGRGNGADNDLVSFLSSPEIGLRIAASAAQDEADRRSVAGEDMPEGDVIDYFLLSHPHEDHFNGAKALFDSFDVRNVLESKQIHSVRYLKNFKAPAIDEIGRAREAGKDAHFYVVGLPYPNGFARTVDGKPYDEYALCQKNLPAVLADKIDCDAHQGKVRYPFGPAQVAQLVSWPVEHLVGESEQGLAALPERWRGKPFDVEVLPLGTHFELDRRTGAGFTLIHGDTLAAFDHTIQDRETYAEAFPYYQEDDLNDGSLSIHVRFGQASMLIPGDTEGRDKKPTKRYALTEIFGHPEGDAYSKEDLEKYLRRDQPKEKQLPILPMAEPFVLGSRDLRRLAYHSFVSYDLLTPEALEVSLEAGSKAIPAQSYQAPGELPESLLYWDRRTEAEKASAHPRWRERLLGLHKSLKLNSQKRAALKGRFSGWVRGKPRLRFDAELQRFMPDFENPVWTITNLVQLTERIYYVDPFLAHVLGGFIMGSDAFLEYVAPEEKSERAKRGEKHMLDVRAQILAETEGAHDVVKADVLFFGHHGSFTSSSLDFVLAVDPNVGVISADDKSYSGSTLPDFSAIFWNLNTYHPEARAILHSVFFHADMLRRVRGEPADDYADRNRFSATAAKIFRARRRWPIPIWRTDFNDDLVDDNVLVDNIRISSDGSKPIWDWSRRHKGEAPPDVIPDHDGTMADLPRYRYWFQALGFGREDGLATRPEDPSGEIDTFQVDHRLPLELEPEAQDASDDHLHEDWVRDLLDE